MDADYRSEIEQRMCEECIHDFREHEDCQNCERDHAAWVEQMAAKSVPIVYRGISLGDVYAQTRRLQP